MSDVSFTRVLPCRICEVEVNTSELKRHSLVCLEKYLVQTKIWKEQEKLSRYYTVIRNGLIMPYVWTRFVVCSSSVNPLQSNSYYLMGRLFVLVGIVLELNLLNSVEHVKRLLAAVVDAGTFIELHSQRLTTHVRELFVTVQGLLHSKCSAVLEAMNSLTVLSQSVGMADYRMNRVESVVNHSTPGKMSQDFSIKKELDVADADLNFLAGNMKSQIGTKKFGTKEATIDDFIIIKPISRGAYGQVFLAQKKSTLDYFAIKILKKKILLMKKHLGYAQEEQDNLSTSNNPFVVKLYYTFHSEGNVYLVLEYHPGGDCFSLLRNLGRLSDNHARSYLADIVLALEYLHSIGIVHRDLKPDNFLVSRTGHLKLTDFGLSSMYGVIAKHIVKFSNVFDKIMSLMHDHAAVENIVAMLMEKHVQYQVLPKHFELFKIIFIDIISSKLEFKFTDVCNRAWEWFFDDIIIRGIKLAYFNSGNSSSAVHFDVATTVSDIEQIRIYSDLISDNWNAFKTSFSVSHNAKVIFMRLYTSHDNVAKVFQNRFGIKPNASSSATPPNSNIPSPLDTYALDGTERVVGSADYIAPELLVDSFSGNGPPADIWSFGVLMFEFLSGTTPFNAGTHREVFDNIMKYRIDWSALPMSENSDAVDLIKRVLVTNPNDRYSIHQIKQHPFFAGIDWPSHITSECLFVPEIESATDTSYFDAREELYPIKDLAIPGSSKRVSENSPASRFSSLTNLFSKKGSPGKQTSTPDSDKLIRSASADLNSDSDSAPLSLKDLKPATPPLSARPRVNDAFDSPLVSARLRAPMFRRVLQQSHFNASPRSVSNSPARHGSPNSSKIRPPPLNFTAEQAIVWIPKKQSEVCDWFWEFFNDDKIPVEDNEIMFSTAGLPNPKPFQHFSFVSYSNLHLLNLQLAESSL